MVIILGAHRNQSEADSGRQDDIYIYRTMWSIVSDFKGLKRFRWMSFCYLMKVHKSLWE